jgi:hypothetical protein
MDLSDFFTPLDDGVPLSQDIPMKGRAYLPGSREAGFYPESLGRDQIDADFPKVFVAETDRHPAAFNDAQQAGELVRRLIDTNLTKYGAVLLRGLPIAGVNQKLGPDEPTPRPGSFSLSGLLGATEYSLMKYVGGGAKRREIDPNVYSASDREGRHCMSFHQV